MQVNPYRRKQIRSFYQDNMGDEFILQHTQVKGRLRVHLRGLAQFKELKKPLSNGLSKRDIISQVRIHTSLGNITIHFDIKVPVEEILNHIRSNLWEVIEESEHPKKKAHKSTDFHSISPDLVSAKLNTDIEDGLDELEAQNRLNIYGPNSLQDKPLPSFYRQIFNQVNTLPMLLLIGSAGVSIATGALADAVAMLGVVVLNVSIGHHTQSRVERTVKGLRKQKWGPVLCIREGKKVFVPVNNIVPGDLVYLTRGEMIPADIRLIKVHNLTVNESMLTGESEPVQKMTGALESLYLPLSERKNMAYRGTAVTGGACRGIVVATGEKSEVGQIQSLIDQAVHRITPMQKGLESLTHKSINASVQICLIYSALALLRKQPAFQTLQMAGCMAIAAIPEGLPTILTASLARGIHRMDQHHALVRSLAALESLAALDHLCLDKTGTVTLNEMEVVKIAIATESMILNSNNPDIQLLLKICALNSDLGPYNGGHQWNGSKTEKALWLAAKKINIDLENLVQSYPRIKIRYRTEQSNIQTTKHHTPQGKLLTTCKGRPEEVLAPCRFYLQNNKVFPLSTSIKESITKKNHVMATDSLRVLGVACKGFFVRDQNQNHYDFENEWVWIGLVGLEDKIKPGINDLISKLKMAGVQPALITGDQTHTAKAIAQRIQLKNSHTMRTLTQSEFQQMDMSKSAKQIAEVDVFSRFGPSQKLAIVRALQSAGHVVGMTGDGINDGPALKTADVGIAMGDKGEEVAREVADIILLDDNLNTIIDGIEEGRTIHQNVKKAVHFILATNLSEITLPFLPLALGRPAPLSALQYLWINLATDILPEIALAMQSPETDILKRRPSQFRSEIVDQQDIQKLLKDASILTFTSASAYLYALARYGSGIRSNSITFLTLSTSQLSYIYTMLNKRNNESQLAAKAAMAGAVSLLFMPFLAPPLRRLLKIQVPGVVDFSVISLLSLLSFIATHKNNINKEFHDV